MAGSRMSVLGRFGIPALCGTVLVGAGLLQVLLPVEVEQRSCGGTAVTVAFRADRPGSHAEECRATARTMLLFGGGTAAAGLAAGGSAAAAMARRPTPRR